MARALANYAQFSPEEHETQIARITNPDQRAAYIQAFTAPSQSVNLGTAENYLLFPWLQQNAFSNLPPLNLTTAQYPIANPGGQPYNGGVLNPSAGQTTILNGIAAFLSDQWNVTVNPANMYGSSGVIAALEVIALPLFKPGDTVLVPAPLFYGFTWSLSQKTVQMNFVPFPIDNDNNLTVANVQAALKQNPDAKLLVLTNPNNPLGLNYPQDLLEQIYDLFLSDSSRHIISDEIYACSQVSGGNPFVSALALKAYQNPNYQDRIHVTWGLSKDFGLAGFRAAVLITTNDTIEQSMAGGQCGPIPSWYASEAWFAPLVNLQPYVLQKLFFNSSGGADPTLANQAMTQYKTLLQQYYNLAAQELKAGGISYYPNNQGALFFWIDLSKYLQCDFKGTKPTEPLCKNLYSHDDPKEGLLLNYLAANGIQLVRGQECFNTAPGFFRLCYTSVTSQAQLTQGINNLTTALKALC